MIKKLSTHSDDSDYKRLTKDPEFARLLRQEELILDVTESLIAALQQSEITQAELASKLGRTRGFVSQLLGGGRNLTLRTISDVASALGFRPKLKLRPEDDWIGYVVESFPVSRWMNTPSKITLHASSFANDHERDQMIA